MSLKIRVSYTEAGELSKVIKHLAPLDLNVRLPKNEPKEGVKRAYLTTKNPHKQRK